VVGRDGPAETASTSIDKDDSAALLCAKCGWLVFFVNEALHSSIVGVPVAIGAVGDNAFVTVLLGNGGVVAGDAGIGIGTTGATSTSTFIGVGTSIEICVNGGCGIGGSFLLASGCLVDEDADTIAVGLTGVGGMMDFGGVGSDSGTATATVGSRSWATGVASGVGIAVTLGRAIDSRMGVGLRDCDRGLGRALHAATKSSVAICGINESSSSSESDSGCEASLDISCRGRA
jgi:hypothetical protein